MMRKKIKIRRDERGVSPVIGVILMVAATVVIAGVVMAMLGGFAPPEPAHMVSVTADRVNATHVRVTYMGGPDHHMVNTAVNLSIMVNGTVPTPPGFLPTVGNSTAITASFPAHIVANMTFLDGTTQVVLNTHV